MNVSDEFFTGRETSAKMALADMAALEKGAIANPDEIRNWLRNPAFAPIPELRKEIEEYTARIRDFAAKVHAGEIYGKASNFKNYLLIGIGSSALGSQILANTLGESHAGKLKLFFFDPTDPVGLDRILKMIGNDLNLTLCLVVSKSGGAKETHHGMLHAKTAHEQAGLDCGTHAVATTVTNSELNKFATQNKWLAKFPMCGWVSKRISELCAVSLLTATSQRKIIRNLISIACKINGATISANVKENPTVLFVLVQFGLGNDIVLECGSFTVRIPSGSVLQAHSATLNGFTW